MPITTKLYGRLGNQMFQIANCIAHAVKYGWGYKIPAQTTEPDKWPVYFNHFPILDTHFDNFGYYFENDRGNEKRSYRPHPPKEQLCFDGYFQSYRYFIEILQIIYDSFALGFLMVNDKGVNYSGKVAVHVRRGDYLELNNIHPPVSVEYLQKAINYFIKKKYTHFTVYSDDIDWCKQNILPDNNDVVFYFMDEKSADPVLDAKFDLWTMGKHEHQIISNSTFSYWAAMLNRNPNKIIVAPSVKNWFGPSAADLDISEMMPPEWLQIEY